MSNAAAAPVPAPFAVVALAAQERAAALVAKAMAPRFSPPASWPQASRAQYIARAEHAQIEAFQNRKLSERAVCDALIPAGGDSLIASRAEFIAAVDAYIAAGVAEVRKLCAAL